MTGANIISEYGIANVQKKISIILYNLPRFDGLLRNYRRSIISKTWEQIEYNKKGNKVELGVRVQKSGISNPTQDEAITRIDIETMIDTGVIPDAILRLVDDEEETSYQVKNYNRMKQGFEYVNEYIEEQILGREKKLIFSYVEKDTEIAEIAEQLGVEVPTIRQRLWRITLKMEAELKDKFEDL